MELSEARRGVDDISRFIASAPHRHRGQVGAVCFDEKSIARNPLSYQAKSLSVLVRQHAGKGDIQTHFQASMSRLQAAGEGVHDAADRSLSVEIRAEQANDVRLRIATVNDQRERKLSRQGEVSCEVILLLSKGRVIPVAIESSLSNAAYTICLCEVNNLVPGIRRFLSDVIRLNSHGRKDHGKAICYLKAGGTGGSRRCDAQDSVNSCLFGTLQRIGEVIVKSLVVQVSMSIDEFGHVSARWK